MQLRPLRASILLTVSCISAGAQTTSDAPPEYLGFAQPRVASDARKDLTAADAAIQVENWREAVALLDHLLGPATRPDAGPRIDLEGDSVSSDDGIRFGSVAIEVKARIAKLPPAGLDAWNERRGNKPQAEEAPAAPAEPARPADWSCVSGRPDHAALELPADAEWNPGGYARWIHELTNPRKLQSKTPAKNAYYAYSPMQLVASGDLLIGRSHQDIVALDRKTGAVRWRVDSELPQNEQTSQEASGIDSWRYFSDLGGWALAVIAGDRDLVVVTSKSGRGRVVQSKLEFQRNFLRAYDAKTGALQWHRGGADDPDEAIRSLTFTAPPVRAGDKGEVLVAPATSDTGYFAVGLTFSGGLLWVKKIYDYLPEHFELLDESLGLGAALASSGNIIVGSPGQGLIFAINARGETLWESRYPSGVRKTPNDPRWAPGHPIVTGGKVIASPFDGDCVLALDVKSGATLWTKRYLAGYQLLIGADASRAYAIDTIGRVTALAAADGTLVWASEPLGTPAGRGLVTSSKLYVPIARSLFLLDPAKGAVLKRCKIWDERLPDPCPGNLFLSRGELMVGGPWGFACFEPYEATLAGLDSLGIREQLLRRAMVSHALGKYGEALDSLRKAIASTSEESARESLRAELLQITQEAAANTKDLSFIRRVLEEPELIPTKAHRTAFVLRAAELLEKESPAEAAKLYREVLESPAGGDVVVSPAGAYVDVQVYASDALRELVTSGKVEPQPAEDQKIASWIESAVGSESCCERLSAIALRYSHSPATAGASARLSRAAELAGDLAMALSHLDRMLADDPRLAASPGLRELADGLRARIDEERKKREPAPATFDVARPWKRVFLGKSEGTELVSSADGSEPLPGMLLSRDGVLALLDEKGTVVWKHKRENVPDLKEARAKLQGALVEPALAFAMEGRTFVFNAFGLLDISGLGTPSATARSWFASQHPLEKLGASSAQPAAARVTVSPKNVAPQPKITVNDNANTFARVAFGANGDPCIVDPDGTLIVFERRTGRIGFKSDATNEASAGAPAPIGRLIAVESAKPPGLIVYDPRTRARTVISTPATPWRGILVPGIAAVADSSAGVQVRALSSSASDAGVAGDDAGVSRALWRDVKARGFLSLAHADAVQVIAVESGGKLTSRAIRSGRIRWSVPFPDGASPLKVFELDGGRSAPGDLVIAASRGIDPEDGRGVLGQKVAQDLIFLRVSLGGEKRWEASAAEGGVSYAGARVIAGKDSWVIAFGHKVKDWRARAVVLDIDKGTFRDLFEISLEAKPSYPPPSLLVTRSGLAMGTTGVFALFQPE
jgi:outer membrane protein assembly factor BamB/tetratricopeptide (TPR) repeat protein